jgi:hypothetical protein
VEQRLLLEEVPLSAAICYGNSWFSCVIQGDGHNDAMSKSVSNVDSNQNIQKQSKTNKTMKTDLLSKWRFCTALIPFSEPQFPSHAGFKLTGVLFG